MSPQRITPQRSDGSGTRKPENPTRPEAFLLTRTRPEPEKKIQNPTRPEPEKLQTRPKTRRVLFLQKFEQNCPFLVRIWVFFWKNFLADQFYSMLPILFCCFLEIIFFDDQKLEFYTPKSNPTFATWTRKKNQNPTFAYPTHHYGYESQITVYLGGHLFPN